MESQEDRYVIAKMIVRMYLNSLIGCLASNYSCLNVSCMANHISICNVDPHLQDVLISV